MKRIFLLGLLLACLCSLFAFTDVFEKKEPAIHEKVLICGVCRNIHSAAKNTIKNIEKLGQQFEDYAVIIYENNSDDNTVEIMQEWASRNSKVLFKSEYLAKQDLPVARTEKIARARNIVLELASDAKYSGYKYLIMADLDFRREWPHDEIINSMRLPIEWDCISANGVDKHQNLYWDRYALRFEKDPFGPELFGEGWWLYKCPIFFDPTEEYLVANYSAFGGMAIYKTATLLKFRYSGTVTKDLEDYYKKITAELPQDHRDVQKYLKKMRVQKVEDLADLPLSFEHNAPLEHPDDYEPVTCCEHVPLHATMALSGHGKFYINSKMIMQY